MYESEFVPVGFHYLVYFVNFAVKTAGSNEPREFPVGKKRKESMVNWRGNAMGIALGPKQ